MSLNQKQPQKLPQGLIDEQWMQQALVLARNAAGRGDVPIGALIVTNQGYLAAQAYNEREALPSPIAHAEILALERAAQKLGRWRLNDCTLYVTIEPCAMCAGALVNARIRRLVYGALDPKAGAVDSLYKLCNDERLNHRLEVTGGVLERECSDVIKAFFKSRRDLKV